MDTEERLNRLESLVEKLGERVVYQGREIERLRMELHAEITHNASLPVGTRHFQTGFGPGR